MKDELQTLKYIRKIMCPIEEKKYWIAGGLVDGENYVLIRLRQKVLKRIHALEKEKEVD